MKFLARNVVLAPAFALAAAAVLAAIGCGSEVSPSPPNLGRLEFPTSASSPAQEHFLRGVLLLHSFEYDDAREAFVEASEAEPGFAMAYWGEAMTHNHPLWSQRDADAARAALKRLAPSVEERLEKAPTEREKGYLRAVETLYGEGAKHERDVAYRDSMGRLAAEYPDDLEAAAFHALATLGASDGGRDTRAYMRAAAIVEEVFAANATHPGAAHYLIHSYDDPVHAPLGIRAARVYAKIAPAAAHALHMPSHIFVSMGMWDEAAASNEDSWAASDARVARKELTAEARGYHALAWLQYSYLQQGRFGDARRLLESMAADVTAGVSKRMRGTLLELQERYRLETGQWDGDSIEVDIEGFGKNTVAAKHFLLGFSALMSGDPSTAKTELRALEALLDEKNSKLQPGLIANQLRGMIELRQGRKDRAVELLRAAAEQEDTLHLSYGPPKPPKPAHELFGEVLLELGRWAEAQAQFERALKRAPRRRLSLLGLTRAAAQAGDQPTAEDAYRELESILHRADAKLAPFATVAASNPW